MTIEKWIVLSTILLLSGCATKLQYAPGADGLSDSETAWIVTKIYTKVEQIDGHDIPGVLTVLTTTGWHNRIAVAPGPHTVTVSYESHTAMSGETTDIVVTSEAGKTNFIYGEVGGTIRYKQMLLDRPADENLLKHISVRNNYRQRPCESLPCSGAPDHYQGVE